MRRRSARKKIPPARGRGRREGKGLLRGAFVGLQLSQGAGRAAGQGTVVSNRLIEGAGQDSFRPPRTMAGTRSDTKRLTLGAASTRCWGWRARPPQQPRLTSTGAIYRRWMRMQQQPRSKARKRWNRPSNPSKSTREARSSDLTGETLESGRSPRGVIAERLPADHPVAMRFAMGVRSWRSLWGSRMLGKHSRPMTVTGGPVAVVVLPSDASHGDPEERDFG